MKNSLDKIIANMNVSFEEIIKKIEWTKNEETDREKNAREVMNDILKVLENNEPPIECLPLNDLEHRLRWLVGGYYITQKNSKNASKEQKEEANIIQVQLINILKTYKHIDIDSIWTTPITKTRDIIDMYVRKDKEKIKIIDKVHDDNLDIQCNQRVIKSIIYELLVNYKKYWKDWVLDLDIKDDSFVLNLNNSKKPKENVYSSNNWLNILKQYVHEIWGEIDYDYSHDECTTTVTIPVKIKEK